MPIETCWYDSEQTIIHNKIVGRWTLHDVIEAFNNADYLISGGAMPYTFIWDFTEARAAPSGLLSLKAFFYEEISPEPNYHTYLVAAPRFIRIVMWTLGILPDPRIMLVETLDEMEAYTARVHEG